MNDRDNRVNLWMTRECGALARRAADTLAKKFYTDTGTRVKITMGNAVEAILAQWLQENEEK